MKFTCDTCDNYWVDLGRLERVSGKRAGCTPALLRVLHLFVTPPLTDEDRAFILRVIREDLPASAVTSDNEDFVDEFATAVCCGNGEHCCEEHCSCDGGDDDDADDDDDDGDNNDPDVFQSSGVWDI